MAAQNVLPISDGMQDAASSPRPLIARIGPEILQSAIDYCVWRSGRGRHRMSFDEWRRSADRCDYLDAARLLSGLLHEPDRVGIAEALPVLNPAPPADPHIPELAALPVAKLVSRLMAADPRLTDKKILSHLSRRKLATMLCERVTA